MKKAICFMLVFIMLLLCGCTTDSDYSNSSDVIVVESIITQLESDIADREQNGEVSIEIYEDIYITDQENYASGDGVGTQTVIIDSEIDAENAEEIKPADINTKGEKPLYYTYLTESQKSVYRYMKSAAEEMKTGLFSLGAVKDGEDRLSDIAIAFRALSSDNPQIFWLPAFYVISPDGSAMAFEYNDVKYPMTASEKEKAEKQLLTTVENISNLASELSSRFEKEKFFHDWLCTNVTYNQDGTDNVFTAYGALINGVAVCEGYARAMQLLCDNVGIPCTVIYGSSRNVDHMWNIINPGDGWYHLDVTWDDDEQYNYARHGYFNLTNGQILQDHVIFDVVQEGKFYVGNDKFNVYLYDCNIENYNYFLKNKLIFSENMTNNANLIIDADNKGQKSLEVFYDGNDHKAFLMQVNIELVRLGYDMWISDYAYLGGSLVMWW